MSPFQLAKHHGTTSCYQKYLLLSAHLLSSRLPLVIRNTPCYRDYLLLLETLLVISCYGNTSCYQDCLLLSRLPLVIGNTSCYPDYLLLSRALLVIKRQSIIKLHLINEIRNQFLISNAPWTVVAKHWSPVFFLVSTLEILLLSSSILCAHAFHTEKSSLAIVRRRICLPVDPSPKIQ